MTELELQRNKLVELVLSSVLDKNDMLECMQEQSPVATTKELLMLEIIWLKLLSMEDKIKEIKNA